MKQVVWAFVLLMTVTPIWAANDKITVQQLKDLLVSMSQNKKTDDQISTRLKELDLSEEMTAAVESDLLFASPGPLTSEQINVMEVRSSMLTPPPSDLPNLPAPDATAQKSILEKAIDVASRNDSQIHNLVANRAVSRYGNLNEFNNWKVGSERVFRPDDHTIMRLKARFSETVKIEEGAETLTGSKDDPRLRKISQTPEGGVRPSLSQILRKANENGDVKWLRWESINGVKTAVFSYSVDKKQALYSIDYCCFLKSDGAGYVLNPFKKTLGLHGQFFIDPETGNTKRIFMLAEFAPTDFVEREDTRIDFDMQTIDGKSYFVPVRSIRKSEVSSMGDSPRGYLKVRTIMAASYGDYRTNGAAQK
jgi:hypothetical protein